MAIRETVAVLDIDEKGAVTALEKMKAELASMGQRAEAVSKRLVTETTQTERAFTRNLTTMRASSVLFGTSLAALGLTAVTMLRRLIPELLRANEEFESASASVTDLKSSFLDLVANVQPLTDALTIVKGAASAMNEALKEANETIRVMLNLIIQLTPHLGGLARGLRMGAALVSPRAPEPFGPPAPQGYGQFPRYAPSLEPQPAPFQLPRTFDRRTFGLSAFEDIPFSAFREDIEKFSPFADEATESIERMNNAFLGQKDIMGELGEEWTRMGNSAHVTVTAFADDVDISAEKFNALMVAATAAGAAIGNALFSAGQSAKEAVAQILKTVAVISITNAFAHLAAAYGATTLLGMALTGGTPAQHKKAAAFWGKVAAFTTGGALALGARDSGSAGTAVGFSPSQTQPGRGTVTPNVTIIVEGSLMGTNKDELAREITDLVRRGQDDGA